MGLVSQCGECGGRFEDGTRFCGQCGGPRASLELVEPPVGGFQTGRGEPERNVVDAPSVAHMSDDATEVDERTTLARGRGASAAEAGPVHVTASLADGRTLPAAARVVIGRDPTARSDGDVVVQTDPTDLSISKTHLALERSASGLWLVDMHSTNGVELSRAGQPRRSLEAGERVLLTNGDQISFGDQGISVVAEAQEPISPVHQAAPKAPQRSAGAPSPDRASAPSDLAGSGLIDAVPGSAPSASARREGALVAGASDSPDPSVGAVRPAESTLAVAPVAPVALTGVAAGRSNEAGAAASEAAPDRRVPAGAGGLKLHSRVLMALFVLGLVALVLLVRTASQWSMPGRDLLAWPELVWLLVGCAVVGYSVLPKQVGRTRSACAGTTAGGLIVAQMFTAQSYGGSLAGSSGSACRSSWRP